MDILVIALVFLGLSVLQSHLISRFGLRGFSYARFFKHKTATTGETIEMTEVIRNKSPLFLPWLRLEMLVPQSFLFHGSEELEIRSPGHHKSVFTLMPFSQVTRTHKVKLTHRGHFKLEMAAATCGDLLGLGDTSKDIKASAEIYVYPALLPESELELPSSRSQGDVSVRRWINDDPFLINGIRSYRAGDAMRDIHWAATARTGQLQVKTHDFTAEPRLMVLLNCQREEHQWGDLMDYEEAPIEYGISLAASLCLRALSLGMEAGFATNMPLDEEKSCTVLLPSRGSGRQDALLTAFSCLKIHPERFFTTFLDEMQTLNGCDIVILSCYDSAAIQERISELRRQGNSVTLRLLPCEEVRHG